MFYVKNDTICYNDKSDFYISFDDLCKIANDPYFYIKNTISAALDLNGLGVADKLVPLWDDFTVRHTLTYGYNTVYKINRKSFHLIRQRTQERKFFSVNEIDGKKFYTFWAMISSSRVSRNLAISQDFLTIVSEEQLRHRNVCRFAIEAAIEQNKEHILNDLRGNFDDFIELNVDGEVIYHNPKTFNNASQSDYLKTKLSR